MYSVKSVLPHGELTAPSQSGYAVAMYAASHLNFCDVAVDDPQHPSFVQVTLKAPTMDPFYRGGGGGPGYHQKHSI